MTNDANALGSVDGRRILLALAGGAVAAGLIGTASWLIQSHLFAVDAVLKQQIITIQIYGVLVGAVILSFRSQSAPPLSLTRPHFSYLALVLLTLFAVVAASALIYALLSPLIGGVDLSARRILMIATDVKRIEGAPLPVWVIATLRGTLVTPLFEELLFRGALTGWLSKYMVPLWAIAASAGMFAVAHGFPIVMPYAFLFGLAAGWLRLCSGSLLPGLLMHALNSQLFLGAGLALLH